MADQDIMALMQGQQDQGAPPPGAPPAMTPPPMPSPMSTPEPKAGQREAALINVSMALDLIEQSLPAIGSETPEGQSLMSALSKLSSVLGPKKQKAGELQSAEILQLLQNLPQAGGGSPLSKAIAGGPPNLGLMGGQPPAPAPAPGPAGAPPAMPPGMPPGGPTPAPM
jgi:hypothetical protein